MKEKRIISFTSRNLCKGDFLTQVKNICETGLIKSIYLREKDLPPKEYEPLAIECLKICSMNNVQMFVVQYIDVARNIGLNNVHLSYKDFISMHDTLTEFKNVSVSVHSTDEAMECQRLGATRLITGHIFATDCKKGIAPRGLEYLKGICNSVNIPVYAIGGIDHINAHSVVDCGANGFCVMSTLMESYNPKFTAMELYSSAFLR